MQQKNNICRQGKLSQEAATGDWRGDGCVHNWLAFGRVNIYVYIYSNGKMVVCFDIFHFYCFVHI